MGRHEEGKETCLGRDFVIVLFIFGVLPAEWPMDLVHLVYKLEVNYKRVLPY